MENQPEQPAPPEIPSAAQAVKNSRRARSRIAHLPKTTRDQINVMLQDGLTYAEIIEHLGDAGKDLNKDNLSHWHGGEYKDWLKDQVWIEEMRSKLNFATRVLQDKDGESIHEAGLRIAVKQMYDLLSEFDPAVFEEKLAEDPASYARVLNALSKITEAALKYQRQRTEQAERQARESRANPDPSLAGLTLAGRRKIEEEHNIL